MNCAKIFVLLPLFLLSSLTAEEWPGWRGPHGDGSSNSSTVPLEWNVQKDTVWKTKIPGVGHASPVVWKERIFLVSAEQENRSRNLLCLDRSSGKILWKKVVLISDFEDIHRFNSRASSTPVTDGKTVYVSFLDGEKMYISAFDFEGNQLWEKRPGIFSSKHGYCSSPVLWKEKIIINGDHDGDAYIVALHKQTGETLWKTERPNKTRSYCTPIIRTIDGRNQLILSGSKSVASYDPDTGEQHWVIDGPTEQFVASLVYNGSYLFMTCGFPAKHMLAIDPTGSGNVTDTHIAWRDTAGASYVPSPVTVGDYFVVVADNGVGSCFVAETGERHWRERLPGKHSASMVTVRGHAVFLSDLGVMSAVEPGPEFVINYQSELGEETYASPVIHNDQWLLRGVDHLYCIGRSQ
ncbi:MAG: PQQ-binding-like beta-propeller repeat protein [Verrucomicrobiales bacterium]|nr:PQQ-binding-like beta-propeller repeat protein [Verrucomicrobiales bacterium]